MLGVSRRGPFLLPAGTLVGRAVGTGGDPALEQSGRQRSSGRCRSHVGRLLPRQTDLRVAAVVSSSLRVVCLGPPVVGGLRRLPVGPRWHSTAGGTGCEVHASWQAAEEVRLRPASIVPQLSPQDCPRSRTHLAAPCCFSTRTSCSWSEPHGCLGHCGHCAGCSIERRCGGCWSPPPAWP